MSLHLHLSARSDDLLAALRPRLAAARTASLVGATGIPRPVPVLVPSVQLGDWLQVRLARDLGLSMGFEFLQPRTYFSRHFAADPQTAEFADSHAYWAPDRLRWRILPHIDAIAANLGQDPAQGFSPRDRFAAADLLAQQFDRYARFRPDWPEKWAANKSGWNDVPAAAGAVVDEAWQRQLWRRLSEDEGAALHPARLLGPLARVAPIPSESPPPLFVVGTDVVDPLLLRTLEGLSQRGHEVSLFLLLPSLGYLGDISRRAHWRTALAADPGAAPAEGHPLLASLGQQAVGTFLLLESIAPDYAAWPEVEGSETTDGLSLLGRLQEDIRLQQSPAGQPANPGEPDLRPAYANDDRSLRIHCCHSPRRELEVLRDELLRAFAELPDLKPEEVLIAVTNFDTYAPLAEGVLRAGANPLPVRLTAMPAREANPVAVGLLALLRLALGRRTASDLVELFNLTALQHRLDVAGEPEVMGRWVDAIRQSGLTHGLDAHERSAGETAGTWRAALDRHLAGSWFGPVAEVRDVAGHLVHPLAGDLPHHDGAISRLSAWLTDLAGHLRTWTTNAPAAEWALRLAGAIDDLLLCEILDDHAAAVRRLLGELAGVETTVELDAGTLVDWLEAQLENATSLRTSMGGEILLGRVDQVHGLPCRVLAILGLEDGAFPRTSRRPAWDLLAHEPRRWDADPRIQDRQWFLDGLLAPGDRLILAAANRSLRTPHDGPLASCVEDLVRVAAASVRPGDAGPPLAQRIVVSHRIQPFATDYFRPDGPLPRSFDAGAARIAGDIIAATPAPAPGFYAVAPVPAASPADDGLSVSLALLISFWRDPARAWLRSMQIEVGDEDVDDTTLDAAPVTLDPLQQYGVRQAALGTRLPGATSAAMNCDRLISDRALPPGALGRLAWEKYASEVEPLATALAALLPQSRRVSLDFALDPPVRLTGEVLLAENDGPAPWVLCYRTSRFDKNPKYQLDAYIQTLAAAVHLARPVHCRVLGIDATPRRELNAINPDEARARLRELLAGYAEGQHRPLCFAPQTSTAWVEAEEKGSEAPAATAQARWEKEPFRGVPAGEGLSPAALLAWRDVDPFAPPLDAEWRKWANAVAAPLRSWWHDTASTAPAHTPVAP